MSSWHKEITKSLADSVSAVLSDMKEDQKASQNSMMKKGKGEAASKSKQQLPEEDEEENGNGNGKKKKMDPVNKKALKKDFASRAKEGDADIDNDGDEDESDKFLHKKRKAISKAIRNTSAKSKKVDLSKKKEKVKVNPMMGENFADERAQLRENLEASFDTVFKYSNKEEESFRDQWMNEFDSHVSGIDPQAYIDPLQRKVLYIEGLTASQAANRYLAHCVANASMAGGEYSKGGTRGGDRTMSSQHQGKGPERVHHPRHQVKH